MIIQQVYTNGQLNNIGDAKISIVLLGGYFHKEKGLTVILPGHGNPGDHTLLTEDLKYPNFVDRTLKTSKSKEGYKSKIISEYPDYGSKGLLGIYLNY